MNAYVDFLEIVNNNEVIPNRKDNGFQIMVLARKEI